MKDAYYFSHDSNAKDDPKCMLLIDQLGLEGYGIFWVLVEILRDQPEYKYPIDLVPILARRYNTSSEKMKAVVLNYNLFSLDDKDNFFSLSLKNRMSHLESVREKRKIAGIASGKARKQKALNKCSSNVKHKLNKNEQSKVKESKVKNNNIDISINFYQNEIKDYEGTGYIKQYIQFVDIILGKSKHYDKQIDNVLKVENQVSYREFCKLYDKSKLKKEKSLLSSFLLSMANDDKYTKGKKSLYLTMNNWLKRHE